MCKIPLNGGYTAALSQVEAQQALRFRGNKSCNKIAPSPAEISVLYCRSCHVNKIR